jgi:molybdenum cofactor cytidylyltransferase
LHGWSALILAAGAGRRFGGGKLLSDLGGAPVIRRVAEAVARAGFAEIVLVTGADDAGLRSALAGRNGVDLFFLPPEQALLDE